MTVWKLMHGCAYLDSPSFVRSVPGTFKYLGWGWTGVDTIAAPSASKLETDLGIFLTAPITVWRRPPPRPRLHKPFLVLTTVTRRRRQNHPRGANDSGDRSDRRRNHKRKVIRCVQEQWSSVASHPCSRTSSNTSYNPQSNRLQPPVSVNPIQSACIGEPFRCRPRVMS